MAVPGGKGNRDGPTESVTYEPSASEIHAFSLSSAESSTECSTLPQGPGHACGGRRQLSTMDCRRLILPRRWRGRDSRWLDERPFPRHL